MLIIVLKLSSENHKTVLWRFFKHHAAREGMSYYKQMYANYFFIIMNEMVGGILNKKFECSKIKTTQVHISKNNLKRNLQFPVQTALQTTSKPIKQK